MNIIKVLFLLCFYISSTFADENCDVLEKGTLGYDMYCGDMYEGQDQLKSLKTKVRDNANFILMWRIHENENDTKKVERDLVNFGELENKAITLISELAKIHCDLALGIGGSIGTAGQGTVHNHCLKEFSLNNEKLLYDKLNDYTFVRKPSFNCKKASTKVEKSICKYGNLSSTDKSIGAMYIKAIDNNITVDQKNWLKNKRNACENSSNTKSCLSTVMEERSSYLYSLTKHL